MVASQIYLTTQHENRSCLLPSLREHSPLKDQILTRLAPGHVKPPASKYAFESSLRPIKYKEWSELSMRGALDAIHEGMSVSKASKIYGIPRTTLNDHKLGKVKPGVRSGPPPLLSTSEEDDLVEFLLKSADICYGRTMSEVLLIVSQMLARKGIKHPGISNGWWNKFICRRPFLRMRTPATLSMSHAKASTRECINAYFDTLEVTLQETGLAEYPALYFNMDETGFAYDPRPNKTVHICGEKNVLSISSGSNAQVTVITCVSATGQAIPPLVIWKRKTMTPDMAIGEIPGTHYGFSESGWTYSSIFDSWFKKLFLR